VKLLLIRFSSLGDVVLATAAANFAKAAHPEAEITFLTKPAYAALLANHPAIARVWSLEGGSFAMARRIRAEGFDGVLDLQGKVRSRFFSALSGAPSVRVDNHAWNRRLRVWLRGSALQAPPDVAERGVRAAARLLKTGFKPARPSLAVSAEAAAWADAWLAEKGVTPGEKIMAICPGAAWATKRWNPGAFAQAMGLLAEEGMRFLFVGDAVDAALAQRIIGYSRRGGERALVAAGQTGFSQFAALLSRARVLLSNDSGPMHVANALGVPVVALFGPTVEAFGFFPRGPRDIVMQRDLGCRPCSVHGGDACPLGHHDCMEKIAPFEVAKAVEGILKAS
jgi:heptosyltransferase-2